jgi:hypothetical protein
MSSKEREEGESSPLSSDHAKSTREMRQLLHPLELNDRLAFETIKTVRLDFLTNEARAPIPRCQELPSHAFGRLMGRSILVSLSHGWFFQTHPDPYGEKLDLIRNVFAPQLRERYPHTDIQVFFDFLSSPQRPRTKEEDEIFAVAMDRMNSMYVYADVIVFLEVDLPKLDMTIRSADVDLSKYKFFDFVDTIQVSETKSKSGPQQYDCIQTCESSEVESASQLNSLNDTHTLTYLYRPFGRPNKIVNDDRGWLFLERITIAIKAAAANKSQFDDIVVSNSEKLRLQIYKWCERLRTAASKQTSEPRALPDLLNHFDGVLKSKRFSFSSDEDVVRGLMKKLVNQFASDWKGETEKQKSMSKRARELLLRWGEFSEQYVERAGFLRKEEESWSEILRTLLRMLTLLICPVLTIYLFWFDVLNDPSVDSNLLGSIFVAAGMSAVPTLVQYPMKLEFIPFYTFGIHTVIDFTQGFAQVLFFSYTLRLIFGISPIPFEFLVVCLAVQIIGNKVIFGPKLISTTHPRTKENIRVSMLPYCRYPVELRFDPKLDLKVNLILRFAQVSYAFGFMYPILAGIFFNSGVLVQSFIVPTFFFMRASYEYGIDVMSSDTFGSDGMPIFCLCGVGMHEVCLTLMMTSISHPLIFGMLILCDMVENVFCLWSLHRTINGEKRSNKIVPQNDEQNESSHRKTLTKRASSVYSLLRDLDSTTSTRERQGTALFIAATLLQRELIETFVPMQAMGIISILYGLNVKSNSVVSSWTTNDEYHQTIMYMKIDLGAEILVFTFTIITLSRIFPDVSVWRVLSGLLRMHFIPMLMVMCCVWYAALLLQSTHLGMDTTFRFSWLECGGKENSTWLGGFDWEC